jgi:hypothetical protein
MVPDLMWIVAGIGALSLAGVFWKMIPRFGPMNLRAIGQGLTNCDEGEKLFGK